MRITLLANVPNKLITILLPDFPFGWLKYLSVQGRNASVWGPNSSFTE